MKINLGSGLDYKDGFVNVDYASIKKDLKHDLTDLPYPFRSNSSELIYCFALLEHLPIDFQKALIDECHRILKKGGMLFIKVPHFTSHHSWNNIEHVKGYSIFTFDSYKELYTHSQMDYMHENKFSFIYPRLVFGKKYAFWNHIIESLANWFPEVYEGTGLKYLFPAEGVHIRMVK